MAPRRPQRKTLAGVALIICIAGIAWAIGTGLIPSSDKRTDLAPQPPLLVGSSENLTETSVVPELGTSWPQGNNAIWCASLVGAWKILSRDVVGEPIMLKGAEKLCERLASANDPGSILKPTDYYAAAGWVRDGIIEKIHSDFRERFPGQEVPEFPGIIPESMLGYAYLETRIQFAHAYLQHQKPFAFISAAGDTTLVRAFGLPPGESTGPKELREQVEVLFFSSSPASDHPGEYHYAVDLCRASEPYQVIVARIPRRDTLAETIHDLESQIQKQREDGRRRHTLSSTTLLLVPELAWRIRHEFAELEHKPFLNENIAGPTINCVLQDTQFRLDRSGVQLRSEAKVYTWGISHNYIFDGPFLILVKDRASGQPFFAMWVETAELLQPWVEKELEDS